MFLKEYSLLKKELSYSALKDFKICLGILITSTRRIYGMDRYDDRIKLGEFSHRENYYDNEARPVYAPATLLPSCREL